jgi:thioredoxin-like negative regulator of GroEL
MHRKHAPDGLSVITVNLDDYPDPDSRKDALAFLQKSQATFTNLGVAKESDQENWMRQFRIRFLPHAVVYDREGRPAKEFNDGVDHDELEQVVARLLKKR